uniref:EF-hand domain-containing protein n=1 Tax=Gadus morhua TaxID=8049 RepID=A0A8C4ZLH3_GADMO
MEQAIVAIINVFHKYSGNKSKLKKAELKHLINNEMSQFIMKIEENDTLDRLFADLDQNGDLEIDFQEFISLIAMASSWAAAWGAGCPPQNALTTNQQIQESIKGNACVWRVRWLYQMTSPRVRQAGEQLSFSGGPQDLLNLNE